MVVYFILIYFFLKFEYSGQGEKGEKRLSHTVTAF
jgi:hypothetical protein